MQEACNITPAHTQHTKDYTAVEAERDRSGVRGAEGWGRPQTFSNSFTLMQGVPGLHNTAANTIRGDYVGLHGPAGRVSACCTRQVLGSPACHLGDGLVRFQVRLPAFPRTHHVPPTLPVQQSGLHRAAGTTLQPSVIRSKMVTVKGCGESWAGDTWATHLGFRYFRNVKPSITVLDDPVHATQMDGSNT